jgi:hypothetical protein
MWKTELKKTQFFVRLLNLLLEIQRKGHRMLRNTNLYIFQNKSTTVSTAATVRDLEGRTAD